MVAICVVATIAYRSGVYVGSWGSNLAGWGTFGGENMELDLIAGYRTKLTDTEHSTSVSSGTCIRAVRPA